MKSPLFKFPRAAQPPKVVLLPDSHFFVRVVPIAPGSSAAEAASQAELAVESLSPFPATQLFYGFYWLPGADDAVIYAAYRRRFTPEQTATWNDAQLVIPAFVAALGLPTIDGSTLVLDTVEGFTAIRWAASPIPAAVAHRPAPRELDEVIRASERRALLAAVSAGGVINDIATDPVVVEGNPDDGVVFRVAEATARLDAAQASRADVRDKAALAEISRRNARARLLWRGFVGTAAALVVLAVGELALIGGGVWQRSREAQPQRAAPRGAAYRDGAESFEPHPRAFHKTAAAARNVVRGERGQTRRDYVSPRDDQRTLLARDRRPEHGARCGVRISGLAGFARRLRTRGDPRSTHA
ncbi:MAG: hypothetical protein NVV63_02120 [Opitutus sp.]|nr:hypothetical protein [Opitutus sp.]